MRLKWYGTASILLEHDGTELLFDPFLSLKNGKTYSPFKNELSAVNNILVTHGHLDHISDIPEILGCGAAVYCTSAPRAALISKGVGKGRIHKIAPGDVLSFGPFEVRVYKGKHIVFDLGLIIKTLVNPRILFNRSDFKYLMKENKQCAESGETVIYEVCAGDKRVFLMGSLNLDKNTTYPKGADLLIMPLQGKLGICKYAMRFVRRLQPKKILLDHFDDTFPPVSSFVNTKPFISLMQKNYPGIPVICPKVAAQWIEVE
jgi:L-ascorbate metabolism protein UlaG (beta-lactamase superfamily)